MTISSDDILGVTRSVTKEWTRQRKAEERGSRSRYSRIYVYCDRVNFTDVAAKILPDAYQHASGGGRYTVSKRQIYYACRLDWSPIGQKLAVGSSDGTVRLRSAKGDHESVLTGHRGEVVLVRWSPKGDKLAAGVSDPQGESVHLWSAGATPGAALYPFYENRCPLAWSPDGFELAMAHGSSVRIWRGGVDADDVMDVGPFASLAWSPDGEILAGGLNGDGDVHLWVRKSRKHLVLKGHTHGVNSVDWSLGSEWLASGSQGDGMVRLWRNDGTPGPLLDGGDEPVKSVVWSPDGKWLAVEGDFEVVQLWEPNGVPGRVFKQPGSGLESREGPWSPESSRLAVLGREALHVYWIDGTREVQVSARMADYTAVDWSPDGSRIAVGASDNTVLVCDGNTIEPLWVTALLPNGQSAAFSVDGQILDGDPGVLESEFVYLVTPRFGSTEVLKPSEFSQRFQIP